MIDGRFVYLSVLLNLVGTVHYIAGVLAGRIQPNRASWLLWGIAPAVVLAAELQQGVGLRAMMTFAVALGPFLVLIASFRTSAAYWRLRSLDRICAGLSAAALALWAVSDSADVAIVFSILSDALAAVPTVRKIVTHPDSENALFFLCASLGGGITILTIRTWSFADWAFPVYIFVFPGLLALLIVTAQAPRRSARRASARRQEPG